MVYIYIICGYQTNHHRAIWHKTLLGNRLSCLVDVVYQCIVVLSVTLLYFLGDQVSMHPREADWTNNRRLLWQSKTKEVLNAPSCINYGQHMWSCCYDMCTMALRELRPAVRDSWFACNQPVGCICVHCNLRVRSSSFIVTLKKGYIFIYYGMTLGYKSLGLVVVLFNHSTYPCFWESFHL